MINLTGKRFGKLVVLSRSTKRSHGSIYWNCHCDCGREKIINGANLRRGITRSCGCNTAISAHARAKDLSGRHFGKLIALEPTDIRKGSFVVWKCLCTNCGSTCYIPSGRLNHGQLSCGNCGYAGELTRQRMTKWHSDIERQAALRFNGMVDRCYNKRSQNYPDYGGRGIYIVKEWTDDRRRFVEWAIKSGFTPDASIDRIDVDGPYAPWNCRWVGAKLQANNRRSNIRITVDNQTHTLSEWADILHVDQVVLYTLNRINDNHMDLIEYITYKMHSNGGSICH